MTTVMTCFCRTRIEDLKVIALLRKNLGLYHLRRIVLRIGIEVPHQALKVRGLAAGSKCSAAPVVQHGSGQTQHW